MPCPEANFASLCVDDSLDATCAEAAAVSANGLVSSVAATEVGFEAVRTRSARAGSVKAGTVKAVPVIKVAATR